MVVELVLANTMVVPSGAARAAVRMAMTPLAPGRLSTTTCWPSAAESLAGDDPRHRVVAAARRERHDHGDGAVGKVLGRGRTMNGERDQGCEREDDPAHHSTFRLSLRISAPQRASSRSMSACVFLGRRRQRIAAVGGDAGAHVGRVDAGAKRAVEPLDDRLRRAGRRQQAVVQARLEARQAGLRRGRHVGQMARPLRRQHRQRLQRAGLEHAHRRRQHVEAELDVAAEQIGRQRAGAAIGDDGDVDAGQRLEQLAAEIGAGAGRRRADVELARLALGRGDHVGERILRRRRMRHQHDRRRGDQPDRARGPSASDSRDWRRDWD